MRYGNPLNLKVKRVSQRVNDVVNNDSDRLAMCRYRFLKSRNENVIGL